MASVFDLANLSAMAYDSKKSTFSGWVKKDQFGNPSGSGFYAEFYYNAKRKDAVMAIRGTDFEDKDWSDFSSDLQIGIGLAPIQIHAAEKAFKQFQRTAKTNFNYSSNFYLTGHSLGGGLASLLSAKKAGLPTVTFNAPGMQRSFIGSHLFNIVGYINLRYVDTSQMLHIRATGDPVSLAAGKHMGKLEEVYVDNWGDGKVLGTSRHLAQHSIDNMVTSLRTKFWYQKDLGFKSNYV